MERLKGLNEYTGKYGRHFTVQLAESAVPCRWKADRIGEVLQRKVYYNVTGSTEGDIVYLTNMAYRSGVGSLDKCLDFTIEVIGNYAFSEGYTFCCWVYMMSFQGNDIDFTKYI